MIAAALAIAIVTVVAGLSSRYGAAGMGATQAPSISAQSLSR
ncbi:hypothetical protein [Bosea sp. 117]|nr:hypothetical protein [Bosea sp. 117]